MLVKSEGEQRRLRQQGHSMQNVGKEPIRLGQPRLPLAQLNLIGSSLGLHRSIPLGSLLGRLPAPQVHLADTSPLAY
jgi:hypothetical protein